MRHLESFSIGHKHIVHSLTRYFRDLSLIRSFFISWYVIILKYLFRTFSRSLYRLCLRCNLWYSRYYCYTCVKFWFSSSSWDDVRSPSSSPSCCSNACEGSYDWYGASTELAVSVWVPPARISVWQFPGNRSIWEFYLSWLATLVYKTEDSLSMEIPRLKAE